MIKREIDTASGKRVIVFYYPYSDMIRIAQKETSYRVKMMLEAMEKAPGSLIFDGDDNKEWLVAELKSALSLIAPIFGRLSDNAPLGDAAIFFSKDIDEEESLGLTVIDHETADHPLLKHLDHAAEQFLSNKALFAWYTMNNQIEATKHYALQSAGNINNLHRARELIKKNRVHLQYPAKDAMYYPDNYDMSGELQEYLNNE